MTGVSLLHTQKGQEGWTNIEIAIPREQFWINPKTKIITVLGSGDQRVSMSRIDMCARGIVAALSSPSEFANRPAYFADYTVSTNTLVSITKEILGPEFENWNVVRVELSEFFVNGKAAYKKDTEDGVKDRLNTVAYQMLGTYGVFEEGNHYGADFEGKLNRPEWQKGNEELKEELRVLLKS